MTKQELITAIFQNKDALQIDRIKEIFSNKQYNVSYSFEACSDELILMLTKISLIESVKDNGKIESLSFFSLFLIHYNTNRKHGGLKKELKVRTPCEAVKSWFDVEPEIFKISPDEFYTIALNGMVQRGET